MSDFSSENTPDGNSPSPSARTTADASLLSQLLTQCGTSDDNLIEILHAIQGRRGYLERDLLRQVARALALPPSLVYGVASFYHSFRLTPPGSTICSICTGTACHLKGGSRLLLQLEQHLGLKRGIPGAGGLMLDEVRCLGSCGKAPLIRIEREGSHCFYGNRDLATTLTLVTDGADAADRMEHLPSADILETAGGNDRIMDAAATGSPAYGTLKWVVAKMTPEEVCQGIIASGLRGRGGAGYPTGRKWQQVCNSPGRKKFVVANGDEGDPGAFMDRTLMESDPHRLLEGMALAGYAVGASRGYVYVRGEYPLAAARLREAISQAEAAGQLGRRICNSRFSFTVRLRIGAGAFVCGEETALLASIMGRRGQPIIRPPYPSQQGLWGCPTLINNVETFANVSAVLAQGAESFKKRGIPGNSGNKIFSVSGDVARCGVIEVALGTTLRQLLEAAGGVTGGTFKAAQTGGASGGCIPASHLDLPLDYEAPLEVGTTMGSGGIVILNDSRCMVDLARFFMQFCSDESCGKCTPCRSGTRQAEGLLECICRGSANSGDLDRLEELCHLMRSSSLCGLGQSAPSAVLGTLRWYRHEYLAHLEGGDCPTGTCPKEGLP